MKKILIIALALTGFLLTTSSAQALVVDGGIKVTTYGMGKVTGDGIDCGSDCVETYSWNDEQSAPSVLLSAAGTAEGWVATSYSGCSSLPQNGKCLMNLEAGKVKNVTIYFFDVQPPTVRISGYGNPAGESIHLDIESSDNVAVKKIEVLLDGEVVLTKTSDFSHAEFDTTQVPEGDHVVQVRATDGNHNTAESLSYTITVDHTAPDVHFVDPVDATNGETASFAFASTEPDYISPRCGIQMQGQEEELTSCEIDEIYEEEVPTEGTWEFVVEVEDLVGNIRRISHPFVVDRTAPEAEFTSGPEDGAEVAPGEVGYAWSAADDLPVTQLCSWDEEDAVSCDGSDAFVLSPGSHSFKVVITDAAGNETTLARSVTVSQPAPDPDPDPDPDNSDRTAPVVKMVAPKQTLRSARKALRLRVRCNEACSGKVVVKGAGGIRFSGRMVLTGAGVAKLKLKPTAKVRRKLNLISIRNRSHAVPRRVKLIATASLSDAAGNTGRASLRFRLGA